MRGGREGGKEEWREGGGREGGRRVVGELTGRFLQNGFISTGATAVLVVGHEWNVATAARNGGDAALIKYVLIIGLHDVCTTVCINWNWSALSLVLTPAIFRCLLRRTSCRR